jgi:hypothetical protein
MHINLIKEEFQGSEDFCSSLEKDVPATEGIQDDWEPFCSFPGYLVSDFTTTTLGFF